MLLPSLSLISQTLKEWAQNAKVALEVAHYGYVLELGRIVMGGEAQKLQQSKDIQEFYLGAQQETQRGQRRWKQRKTWR